MGKGKIELRVLVSPLTLRRVVVLGVALPVVLALWGFALCRCMEIQPSISDYYGLRTRDAFVGILFVVGWFLFAYRGYELNGMGHVVPEVDKFLCARSRESGSPYPFALTGEPLLIAVHRTARASRESA